MPPEKAENTQKRKKFKSMTDCFFPEDAMLSILTRLPVKTILRFKSVCRSWRQLLSTREFMKMHTGQFSSDPKNQSFIIHRYAENCPPLSVFWNIGSDEKKPSILLQHPCPETHFLKIVGCCNGLLCVGRTDPLLGPEAIALWNPAMKLFKFVRIPENEDFMSPPETVSHGFGYDAEVDDYKVVRIVCSKEKENHSDPTTRVEVYSVNSDSWITISPSFDFRVFNTKNVIIVNGNPYWYAEVDVFSESRRDDVLVWFDVRKMVFKVSPLCSHDDPSYDTASLLVDWEGSLGALVYITDDECDQRVESVDVWVFDDGDYIWRKSRTFGPIEVDLCLILQCSMNRKIMGFCGSGNLIVYDLETGSVKVHGSQQRCVQTYSYPYTESLTYLKGN
ncbi:hypothetical protein OROGR_032333 [Orobanche gracilis]